MSKALVFFIATFLKIYLLLILFVFIMAFIRSWIPVHKIRNRLKSMPTLPANALAGIFGILTPSVHARPYPCLSVFWKQVSRWELHFLS